jgi:formylmethanofuran dehydrogenase subunit E-like metal-binding protein
MKKQIRSTLALALGLVFLCCAAATAAPFETAVSTAMQTLSLGKGDSQLLLMTDAPYVRVDGQNALPYLATAQDLTGDSQAGQDLFTLAAIANVWAKDGPYDFLKSAELHNHICPGLTSGYLIAHYIQKRYPLAPGERYTVLASPVWCKEDALQVVLDCTPGKNSLIVKPLSEKQKAAVSVPNPAGLLLVWNAKQKTGRGVALSFDFDRLRSLAPEGAPKAASVLAALDHLGEPERFVSAAATFDLDESRYQRMIEAGSNPYEVVGLVK